MAQSTAAAGHCRHRRTLTITKAALTSSAGPWYVGTRRGRGDGAQPRRTASQWSHAATPRVPCHLFPLARQQRNGTLDALAIETMPDLDETLAIVAHLKEHDPDVAFYVSFQVRPRRAASADAMQRPQCTHHADFFPRPTRPVSEHTGDGLRRPPARGGRGCHSSPGPARTATLPPADRRHRQERRAARSRLRTSCSKPQAPGLLGLGVNCVRPQDAPALVAVLRAAVDAAGRGAGTARPLEVICYPNSGEEWDAVARDWRPDSRPTEYAAWGRNRALCICLVAPPALRSPIHHTPDTHASYPASPLTQRVGLRRAAL